MSKKKFISSFRHLSQEFLYNHTDDVHFFYNNSDQVKRAVDTGCCSFIINIEYYVAVLSK